MGHFADRHAGDGFFLRFQMICREARNNGPKACIRRSAVPGSSPMPVTRISARTSPDNLFINQRCDVPGTPGCLCGMSVTTIW